MPNILDYLDWRGDVPLRAVPFNEADELVLCRLAYLPFEGVVGGDLRQYVALSLPEAVRRLQQYCTPDGGGRRLLDERDILLMEKLAASTRFSSIRLTGYANRLDKQQEKQFSAVTALLPDRTVLVIYRGTDNTMVGWKEDFNMSFADAVPAQLDAVAYLENVAAKFRMAKLRVCGHSKGGNLAVYAAAFCRPAVQARILSVRNNDGPGFLDAVLQKAGYRHIMARTHTYLPESSVFGMLMEHAERYYVVKSEGNLITQHDLYGWQLTRSGPVLLEQLSEHSVFLDAALKEWLAAMDVQQRERLVDSIFAILQEAGVEDLEELLAGKKNKAIFKTVLRVDEDTRRVLTGALRILGDSVRKTLPRRRLTAEEEATPAP